MKVVLINHSDTAGGASVVTSRLAAAMRRCGVDARMIVTSRSEDADISTVGVIGSPLGRRMRFLWERGVIFAGNGFNRSDLFKVSIADTGYDVTRHPWVREADVVILNWINQGVMSIDDVRCLARVKPVVWTMHDMWCMTGACHHAGACDRFTDRCGNCRYFFDGKFSTDLSSCTWKRKKRLYESVSIHFVAVSNWLAGRAADSSLLGGCRLSVIPNAFPIDEFDISPSGRTRIKGVDYSRRLILMGAARLDDPIKGLQHAVNALNILAERYPALAAECQAVFFGDMRDPSALDGLRFPYVHTGRLTPDVSLRDLFSSADVVISTSLYETLPGTLVEGQAAGCVPVSFGEGGQADIIDHQSTGYIARYLDDEDFAAGIKWALESNVSRQWLHESVAVKFGADSIAHRYISLCESLIHST